MRVARGVVSVAGMVLVVGIAGLVVFPSLRSCGVCGRVIDAYDLGCAVVGCVRSVGSTLGLQLGVFGLRYPTPGISEL